MSLFSKGRSILQNLFNNKTLDEKTTVSYGSNVGEMKPFYQRRLDHASKFILPGFEEKKGDEAATLEDSSGEGTGADVAMGVKYEKEINAAAKKYGLNPWFLAAIIKQESNFNATATSHAGARGLMQLMPATAASLGVVDPTDPGQNTMGGAKYIKQMLDKYNGDPIMALAAYNAGPRNVAKHGGVPPFKETRDYVVKIPNNFKAYTGKALTKETAKWQGEMKSGGGGGSLGPIKAGAAKAFINKWRISADYPRYPGGAWHSGIDFARAGNESIDGVPLPAFHAGTVTFAGWHNSYGNYIVIRDKAGNFHYYAHLKDRPTIKAGQNVKVDQIIGRIGNTGNSTGPHLHYEVRPPSNVYKQAMNPRKFLKGTNKGI